MMPLHLASAANLLGLVRAQTDVIGVAVSFGKDSLATLDLCCQAFTRVEAYYLYRVAGLEIVEQWAREVQRRHGVVVRYYPHFDLTRCYRNAVCQPHWQGLAKVPKLEMVDVEAAFRAEADVEWIAYGWRRNDSMSRAMIMKQTGGIDAKARRVYPLRAWSRAMVYAQLDGRGIPRPPTLGRKEQGGLDFHPDAVAALSPADQQRWHTDFPFSAVEAARRAKA
jgi:phosphoadenosine phosphosulfate reductase